MNHILVGDEIPRFYHPGFINRQGSNWRTYASHLRPMHLRLIGWEKGLPPAPARDNTNSQKDTNSLPTMARTTAGRERSSLWEEKSLLTAAHRAPDMPTVCAEPCLRPSHTDGIWASFLVSPYTEICRSNHAQLGSVHGERRYVPRIVSPVLPEWVESLRWSRAIFWLL